MNDPAKNGIGKEPTPERAVEVPPNIMKLARRISKRKQSEQICDVLASLIEQGTKDFADAIQHF